MGKNKNKRKAGISGLARFVLESFNNDNTAVSSSTEPSAPPSAKKLKVDDETSVPTLAEPMQDGGARSTPAVQASSSKKVVPRKEYNASGLVPHYENASQVPEHLQKCKSSLILKARAR